MVSSYLSITPYFPSEKSIFGPFIFDQVQAIRKTNRFDKIFVIKPMSWWRLRLSYTYKGVTVFGFREFQLPSKILPNLFDGLNRLFFLRRLKQLGITDQVVAHIHTSPLAKYGVWLREAFPESRFWLQHHDLDPVLVRLGRLRYCRWHQKLTIRRRVVAVSAADVQICVSKKVLQQLRAFPQNEHTSFPAYSHALKIVEDLPPVTVKKGVVLYNGVNYEDFNRNGRLGHHGAFRIGCVAAFHESKEEMTLIRAIEKLVERGHRNIEVVLVGWGEMLKDCQKYVSEHGLQKAVHFKGVVRHEALKGFYQSLDLFVLPSTFEAFGCVYLEANACGTPFIACRGQGIEEVVPETEKERWLVEPGNVEQLADKIELQIKERAVQTISIDYNIHKLIAKALKELCL